jgi:antitoxin component YwqK of YwqJK toxin-antitoxin module
MKTVAAPFTILLSAIAIALVAIVSGCKSSSETPKPVNLSCPSGSKLVGDLPPDGEEQACWKTVNGEQIKEGPIVIFGPGGLKMMEGNYTNGKQDGEWRMYYESGAKKSVDHYKDGVQTGDHVSWYEDGQIDAKGQYKDGQQDGVWKRWAPDGVKNWEETYKDGKKIS